MCIQVYYPHVFLCFCFNKLLFYYLVRLSFGAWLTTFGLA